MSEFLFKTKYDQPLLLGRMASNLLELTEGINSIPPASIFFHTHRLLQRQQGLAPEPPNDFSVWVTNELGQERLGELLASLDIVGCESLEQLRLMLTQCLLTFLADHRHTDACVPGREFHFMACKTFVMPTQYAAESPEAFAECLRNVETDALRYHVLDRTLRSGNADNDFSAWFREMGQHALADRIARIDPYTCSVEGLRSQILRLVETYANN